MTLDPYGSDTKPTMRFEPNPRTSEMTNNITLKQVDDVAIVTMNNGGHANTVDMAFCEGMLGALNEIEESSRYRAMILRGTGSVFSAGGDLSQIRAGLNQPGRYLELLIDAFHSTILALRRLRIPVIASVHGAAAGGGFSLAMACDIVVASSKARFVVGYSKLGTSSDGGLSFQLARRLGVARALDLFLLKDALNAEEAGSLGLIQRIVDPLLLEETTLDLARKIASYSPDAVGEIKSLVALPADDELEKHLEREKQAFLRCASTAEFQRRVAEFVERSTTGPARTSA
ncbi:MULTISPECIES: enoyl-CoA hydratase/isomerase family protein [Paraburkholderia]|uniref:enoyl-CoA hydratase/isomerase family protein n=1 Tax=Paraburkholderia TaxID=1822464 RepID=UPI00224CD58E|nr:MULTISPECIES: enoyl-CoA hydratase/isomerase family protein [Paraburkholderia]MCX4163637.1 enoyl-CoA hydratase/isomerase family protein [Paraburkholderia megapolitana]MDN7159132.1 enoyl-CoA hydratase/isomerase family protein [Paraburkholderia sp. CHISQ3]MDQ6496179.1 enoyl-CoA hydratase/isomerase family protein [Paraburkholderia megapolitana]